MAQVCFATECIAIVKEDATLSKATARVATSSNSTSYIHIYEEKYSRILPKRNLLLKQQVLRQCQQSATAVPGMAKSSSDASER